jgi:hypothetical protein
VDVEGNVSEIAAKVYHPRDHEASPFFVLVRDYFDAARTRLRKTIPETLRILARRHPIFH